MSGGGDEAPAERAFACEAPEGVTVTAPLLAAASDAPLVTVVTEEELSDDGAGATGEAVPFSVTIEDPPSDWPQALPVTRLAAMRKIKPAPVRQQKPPST